jgi:hypothetical protein
VVADITCFNGTISVMSRERLSVLWSRLPRMLRRLLVVSAATVLFGLGMIFSVLPGPGIPLLVAGLATLAVEYAWARTYLERLRDHGNRLRRRLRPNGNPDTAQRLEQDPVTGPSGDRADGPADGPADGTADGRSGDDEPRRQNG